MSPSLWPMPTVSMKTKSNSRASNRTTWNVARAEARRARSRRLAAEEEPRSPTGQLHARTVAEQARRPRRGSTDRPRRPPPTALGSRATSAQRDARRAASICRSPACPVMPRIALPRRSARAQRCRHGARASLASRRGSSKSGDQRARRPLFAGASAPSISAEIDRRAVHPPALSSTTSTIHSMMSIELEVRGREYLLHAVGQQRREIGERDDAAEDDRHALVGAARAQAFHDLLGELDVRARQHREPDRRRRPPATAVRAIAAGSSRMPA